MEKEEFLKIKEAVLSNEKSNIITTFDGQLHTYNVDELLEKNSVEDILKLLYRTKEITIKISESNLRWVNDYALLTLVELLDSKILHQNTIIKTLTTEKTNLQNKKEELLSILESEQNTIKSLNSQIQDYEKEKLINDVKENKEVETLNNKIKEYEEQLNSNIEQNNSLLSKFENLKTENDNNLNTIEALNKKILDMQNTINEYANTITDMNNSIVNANNVANNVIKKMERIGNKFETGPNIGI